jgi:UPF0716 protein FxsA
MARLILLFTLVPALELWLLIEVGTRIGSTATVGLIVLTGVIGAALARQQGLQVLARLRTELSEGRLPAGPLTDGVIVLVAGALLITPGILTDILGFLCLLPGFRTILKTALRRRFERALREQRMNVQFSNARFVHGPSESDLEDDVRVDRTSREDD